MLEFLKHIFTSSDNLTYSMSKVLAALGGVSLCTNFVWHHLTDLQGFGIGMASIIGALAAKTFVEGK